MNKRSKILAGSSVFSFLAVWGSSLALGLSYSGELFTLFPVLSSIGISTIGPVLIAATALFISLSLALSISFLRSRHLEKKKSKEKEVNKKVNKKENLVQGDVLIDPEELAKERKKVKNLKEYQKEDYLEEAIKNLNKLAIKTIISEEDEFKEAISTLQGGNILYYAAKVGGDKAVKCVKSLGANINYIDSPIYYAIAYKDTKALKHLIHNGVDPTKTQYRYLDTIKEEKNSLLVIAVSMMQEESVKLLLDIGEMQANINAVDYEGKTALMCAFADHNKGKQEQYGVVKLLLDKGANPTIENNKKQTALSLAQKNKCNQKVISLLEKAEASWNKKHKASGQAR